MKKVINSPKAPKAIGPYSQAIEANGTLYISGQLPIDVNTGKFVEGGVKEQTEQCLKNIGYILEEAGYTFDNVVKSTCLLGCLLYTSFRRQLPHSRNNPHEMVAFFMNSQQSFIFPCLHDHQHVIQTTIFKYFVPDTPLFLS